MPWIVDRIEEDLAVLENTESREIVYHPIINLPEGTKDGDAFIKKAQHFEADTSEETAARSQRIREKFSKLKRC